MNIILLEVAVGLFRNLLAKKLLEEI